MDISAANWSEDDNANTTAAPDGAPEGMAPSGVNNVLRAHQGAIKRWYNWSTPKTTAGTSTAYTLSYSVAPGALVDGMTHLVQFNAANGVAPTLNINALGDIPLRFYVGGAWAAVPAGVITADMICDVAYHSSSGTYRIMSWPQVPLQVLDNALPSDVPLNNTGNYFDGPSVNVGTVGTWFVSGTITLMDLAGSAGFFIQLTDGTTVIAATAIQSLAANVSTPVSLSGYITAPVGNLRFRAKDFTSVSGRFIANATGDGKSSKITAVRVG